MAGSGADDTVERRRLLVVCVGARLKISQAKGTNKIHLRWKFKQHAKISIIQAANIPANSKA